MSCQGTLQPGRRFHFMMEAMPQTPHEVLEASFRIAWDYLEGTGELGERDDAARFLADNIEAMMQRGEFRKLLLANKAIDAYRHARPRATLALVS
jgi:hypothetical protein